MKSLLTSGALSVRNAKLIMLALHKENDPQNFKDLCQIAALHLSDPQKTTVVLDGIRNLYDTKYQSSVSQSESFSHIQYMLPMMFPNDKEDQRRILAELAKDRPTSDRSNSVDVQSLAAYMPWNKDVVNEVADVAIHAYYFHTNKRFFSKNAARQFLTAHFEKIDWCSSPSGENLWQEALLVLPLNFVKQILHNNTKIMEQHNFLSKASFRHRGFEEILHTAYKLGIPLNFLEKNTHDLAFFAKENRQVFLDFVSWAQSARQKDAIESEIAPTLNQVSRLKRKM